jgi:CheY-like chemotaxis protein
LRKKRALALLTEGGLDLVLTDYRMAEMNGYELLRHIKDRDPGIMVILVTAYATVEKGGRRNESGCLRLPNKALY